MENYEGYNLIEQNGLYRTVFMSSYKELETVKSIIDQAKLIDRLELRGY